MPKPKFLISAEHRANELGVSVEEVLESDLRALRELDYPGPFCITPNEIEYVRSSGATLPTDRQKHLEECEPCRVLMDHTTPDPLLLDQFMEQVRTEFRK